MFLNCYHCYVLISLFEYNLKIIIFWRVLISLFINGNFLTCLHWMFLAGSFHLLHLMFDDYVLFLVENLYSQERSKDFLRHIKGEITGRTYSNNHIIHKCINNNSFAPPPPTKSERISLLNKIDLTTFTHIIYTGKRSVEKYIVQICG